MGCTWCVARIDTRAQALDNSVARGVGLQLSRFATLEAARAARLLPRSTRYERRIADAPRHVNLEILQRPGRQTIPDFLGDAPLRRTIFVNFIKYQYPPQMVCTFGNIKYFYSGSELFVLLICCSNTSVWAWRCFVEMMGNDLQQWFGSIFLTDHQIVAAVGKPMYMFFECQIFGSLYLSELNSEYGDTNTMNSEEMHMEGFFMAATRNNKTVFYYNFKRKCKICNLFS